MKEELTPIEVMLNEMVSEYLDYGEIKIEPSEIVEDIQRLNRLFKAYREKHKHTEQEVKDAWKNGAVYGMNVNGGCEWTVDDDEICEEYYNENFKS